MKISLYILRLRLTKQLAVNKACCWWPLHTEQASIGTELMSQYHITNECAKIYSLMIADYIKTKNSVELHATQLIAFLHNRPIIISIYFIINEHICDRVLPSNCIPSSGTSIHLNWLWDWLSLQICIIYLLQSTNKQIASN